MKSRYLDTKNGRVFFSPKNAEKILNITSWYVDKVGYVRGYNKNTGKLVLMHVFIMGKKLGLEIDHINGNRRDNRTENLRFVTRQQNLMNKKKVKGYSWTAHAKAYRVYIKKDGKLIFLGYTKTENEAKEIRKRGVEKYFLPVLEKINL